MKRSRFSEEQIVGVLQKGMSRENTSPPAGKEKLSCIQAPAIHRGCFFAEALFASIRTSRFHCICSAFIPSWLRLPSSAVSTMVLSETRGLRLCWVVRGSIPCLLRLAAYPPHGHYPRTRAHSDRRTAGHTTSCPHKRWASRDRPARPGPRACAHSSQERAPPRCNHNRKSGA
jgi:hypothetical protein